MSERRKGGREDARTGGRVEGDSKKKNPEVMWGK